MQLDNVIIAPLVTEKSEDLKAPRKDVARYTFRVHTRANKELIRQALHHLYKVNAVKVNTMIVPGKMRRFRQDRIKLPKWKKAIVTLAPGQTLDLTKPV
ncbi:MAG: 50S ribosomal protein L23 [Spirochaetales bacterium]|nr:50S ribosomal protein L23 [Leptospiraceae bacterium]MCP5480106.1 50S ribosomal protein L23 [Spirochaetales bacterium]MCP5485554.1 50S ribosomal protein L23 [Spirochaetales bacterium]